MKATFRLAAAITAIVAQLWSVCGNCAIPQWDRGVDIRTVISPIESLRSFKAEDIAKMIPYNMAPTDDGDRIAFQIIDHSLNNFLKSPEIRRSGIGRSAEMLENAVDQDFSFGGEEKGSTKHTVKFKMKPVQTRAQLEYSGLVTAQLSYEVSHEQMNLEISESIGEATQVAFVHTGNNHDQRDMLSLRWQW